jgi:TolB-like protein/cytochrome c-type biogenesis protein CcmH/NrfG
LGFVFANHELDLSRRELRRAGSLIALEPQVFDLLVYLIENRDRVVTKDDLIRTIWKGRIVSESALATRINAARKAVGDSGDSQQLIRTLPRKGFRFVGEVTSRQPPPPAAEHAHALAPALTLPDKPSIAVLSFTNMTGGPDNDYFGDGIAEDVITNLSRNPFLFVIARNSSFSFKGRTVEVKQIARELGVRYVLEGSVRRGGSRVRITAQLIDAADGGHMWAERYDRELTDFFTVQDEITESVAIAIAPAIAHLERHQASRKAPDSLSAWEAFQRGRWHTSRMTVADFTAAKEFFRRAIALDPMLAPAYAGLSNAILSEVGLFQTRPVSEALAEALPIIRKAIEVDPKHAGGHINSGIALFMQGRCELAVKEARHALAIDPNHAGAHFMLGNALCFSGHPREALEAIRIGLRLDPYAPQTYLPRSQIVTAHYFLREYDKAVEAAREALRSYPAHPFVNIWLAAALGQLGRLGEAGEALKIAMTLKSAFELSTRSRPPYLRPEDHEHRLEGLRKAGWQD